MFILHLLSKFFSGVSPHSGFTLIPRQLVTESVFWPASMLKPPPVFRCRQLPHHLVQRCCHCSANYPGTPTSHWDCPSTLRLVDIGDWCLLPVTPTLPSGQHSSWLPSCKSLRRCLQSPSSQIALSGPSILNGLWYATVQARVFLEEMWLSSLLSS